MRYFPRGIVAAAPKAFGVAFEAFSNPPAPFEACGDYAVVSVDGPLEQHWNWQCDSYDAIRERVVAALAAESSAVCLRIKSPGGDFAGSIELAREIRGLAQAAGKRLVAFTDSQALSAGYILACAASEITVTASAFVGSIGVWAPLIDETARDKAQGLNIVIVASGSRKADKNPHVGLTEETVSAMQTQVDEMAGMFFQWVAESRGMSLASIEALQGAEQIGAKALDLHLADHIVNSWGEFLTSKDTEAMAKSFGDAKKAYREALAKVAAGDDEDAKCAKKVLAGFDKEDEDEKAALATAADADGDDDGDKKKKEEASAKAADEEMAKKAAAEEDEKKAAARAAGPRLVASSTSAEMALAKRVQELEAKERAREDSLSRAAALASRPDFGPEVKAFVEKLPLAEALRACKELPRGTIPTVQASATATTPGGTRGNNQGDATAADDKDAAFIREHMRPHAASSGISHNGRESTFGFMTHDEAVRHAAKLNAPKDGGK